MNVPKAVLLPISFLLLAATAFGCGYSEEEMQVKRDRIDQLTRALDKLEQDHRGLKDRFTVAAAENAQLTARLQQMGMSVEDSKKSMDELNKLVEELRTKERQAQARLQTFRNMLEKFNKMIASGKLRVRIVRGRMVVELSENILFDSGKSELKKEGTVALQEVAGVLSSIPDREFQIAGHTDNVPIKSAKFPSNWELSTARAVTVARSLGAQGVPQNRLSAAGYAESQPVASNDTPEGRAQNRRIEIVLMPNLDELPDLSALESSTK
ncbi:MAG TPA: OmpA family protein [Polyangiaceae bacterium]|nr:OmpA family protein [Polyangiaceae bacterium]